MEGVTVYADFDFLSEATPVGELTYERVRGSNTYKFRFRDDWLSENGNVKFSADLDNVRGWQFSTNTMFGCFEDALPDRWGRTLLDQREVINARRESRPPIRLSSFDYLCQLDDQTRMGALRFKKGEADGYINDGGLLSVPPLASVKELLYASQELELEVANGETPEEKWIRQLIQPGSSLGGARPKANVVGDGNELYIAKFPSRSDRIDVALWEHLCNTLAAKAGIRVAETSIIRTGTYHTLLSHRFDRKGGKRIHFASSMAMIGLHDGDGAATGKGYLDIVDFIIGNCADVQENLAELYRRVAFNICVGSTDDHFRNHGFLLTRYGWRLSPAYDINPTLGGNQSLLINETSNDSDLRLLLDSHKDYFIEREVAVRIIQEVQGAVKSWRATARKLCASTSEAVLFQERLDRWTNNI